MSDAIRDRVLALAGVIQALAQVRRIADTGQADAAIVQTALDSVFRIDADSAEAVYGDALALRAGLRILGEHLGRQQLHDAALFKLVMAVLQLERRFGKETHTAGAVHNGLLEIAPKAAELGSSHPDVLSALGGLYADTLSHLRPRVMVQGNPHYLAQPGVVAEIRAILLAAVRSAVLWRQLGGSYWDFAFSRRRMLQAVESWL
ncbi:high frequency lysogenization protein HflD [Pseudoxanthomonas sangjuensis]|uniref:high frequency lysogenization protein HflD n=1 Tax=Pseudoxanthomonas sangjuensis TaxID=1503750 RepID=UPI0013918F26|nr:high frequency lysogenization protein HflD [Pseudoxanthomonas sangjuensis]KAF1713608.1 lysogenization regulator HflD [Pseudoxanthomonas sangjuensis]